MERIIGQIFSAVMTVAIAMVVALRVVAQPVLLSAPAPGMIAICSGGQIVYVSLKDGDGTPSDTVLHDAKCPLSASANVVVFANMALAKRDLSNAQDQITHFGAQIHGHDRDRSANPRGPPV
ncbi:MAG: hypothetical protein AAGF56_09795 [Pseudomonadota bacterium]